MYKSCIIFVDRRACCIVHTRFARVARKSLSIIFKYLLLSIINYYIKKGYKEKSQKIEKILKKREKLTKSIKNRIIFEKKISTTIEEINKIPWNRPHFSYHVYVITDLKKTNSAALADPVLTALDRWMKHSVFFKSVMT